MRIIFLLLILLIVIIIIINLSLKKNNKIFKFGSTSSPIYSLNNIPVQFITPYFNNKTILLSGNYNITDTVALSTIFSGWGSSLLQVNPSYVTKYNNAKREDDPTSNILTNAYPLPVSQYSFQTYINDIYIMDYGNPNSWDVNYNVLNMLKYITNIGIQTNINSSNFPYKIEKIEFSYSLDINNQKITRSLYPVFKLNLIISNCTTNFWTASNCINGNINYSRIIFSGDNCPNISETKTEICTPSTGINNCNSCTFGFIPENFSFVGFLKYPDIPPNSIWINTVAQTYTKNGQLVITDLLKYLNGDNENGTPFPINKAIALIKNKYPSNKYVYATFAEGDTRIIYYLVGDSFDTTKQISNYPPLTSTYYSGYYVGCKPDNINDICINRKVIDGVSWAVYDLTKQICRNCEYGKYPNYNTNTCDFICSDDNYYYSNGIDLIG